MNKAFTITSLIALTLAAATVHAGRDKGAFSVTLPDGTVLSGKQRASVALGPGQMLFVHGKYVDFAVDGDSMAVGNFTLTGADAADRVTGGVRTTVFAERTPLHGLTLNSPVTISLNGESIVILRSGSRYKMKVTGVDRTRGELLKMEPSKPTMIRATLADGFAYGVDALGNVGFSNTVFGGFEIPAFASLSLPALADLPGTQSTLWAVEAGGELAVRIVAIPHR